MNWRMIVTNKDDYLFEIKKRNGELVLRTNDIEVCRDAIEQLGGGAFIHYTGKSVGCVNTMLQEYGHTPEFVSELMNSGEFAEVVNLPMMLKEQAI